MAGLLWLVRPFSFGAILILLALMNMSFVQMRGGAVCAKYVPKSDGWNLLGNAKDSKVPAGAFAFAVMVDWYPSSTSIEEMGSWLHNVKGLDGFWTAFHDSDYGCDPHYHTVLLWSSHRDAERASKWFVRERCPALYPVNKRGLHKYCLWTSTVAAVRYLRHIDHPEKFQYDSFVPELSSDIPQGQKWCDTPLVKAYTPDGSSLSSDFDSMSLMSVFDIIADNGFGTWSALLRACRSDPSVIRAIRRNQYIVGQVLKEVHDMGVSVAREDSVKE